LFERLIVRLI